MIQYFIYKITSPSGRIYIGQTKNPHKRINDYKWKSSNKQALIYNSIMKYGYENHIIEVYLKRYTKEEVNIEEIRLIKIYKNLGISLNISDGGQLSSNLLKIDIIKCDLEGKYIKSYNSIADAGNIENIDCGLLSNILKSKKYYCKGYLWIYKKDWDRGEAPIWKAKEEGKSTKSVKVYQFDLEGNYINTYKSSEEAGKKLGIKPTTISANVRGTVNRVGNFIFSKHEKTEKYVNTNTKPIIQFNEKEEIINEFLHYKEAAKKLGIGHNTIRSILSGKISKKYKNLKIKYK